MGNNSSSKGQVIAPNAGNVPANQPVAPPYAGPSAVYQFLNMDVTLRQEYQYSFLSRPMISSDVGNYYSVLAQKYAEGYRLLSFYMIPGQSRAKGFLSTGVVKTYQGIFCCYPTQPPNKRYQLRIEKSVIQPQMLWNGFLSTRSDTVVETQHLFQTLANNTQNGGRLICIEMTGQEASTHGMTFSEQHRYKPAMGVDMFFEVPLDGPVENFIYNVVSAPVTVITHGNYPQVQCDWAAILSPQLNLGWKLVEIFYDQSETVEQTGLMTEAKQMNSQWFFEKPASRANDPTPLYEGSVVEHLISVRTGFSGTHTTTNWESIIQERGNQGWELACILETPETNLQGLMSSEVDMKVVLFFQRPILRPAQHAGPVGVGGYPGPPPPSHPPSHPPQHPPTNYPHGTASAPPYPYK